MSKIIALAAAGTIGTIRKVGAVVNLSLTDQRFTPCPAPTKQSDESKQLHLSRAEAKRQRRAKRNLRAQS